MTCPCGDTRHTTIVCVRILVCSHTTYYTPHFNIGPALRYRFQPSYGIGFNQVIYGIGFNQVIYGIGFNRVRSIYGIGFNRTGHHVLTTTLLLDTIKVL